MKKKERYHRIVSTPTAVESSAGLTVSAVPLNDVIAEDGGDHEPTYASTSPDGKRMVVRRHDSRGSYSSVAAAELAEDGSAGPDLMMLSHDDDDDDDDDDVPSRLTGEKSPLNLSFDSDERSSTPRLTSNNNISTTVKFALDDDEDDDFDIHLRRYALDFGKNRTVVADPPTRVVPFLWWHIQTARQKARQRRAQLLLQQSERHWRQSLYICLVTTLCDASDGGIALAAAAMLIWILAMWQMEVIRISLLLGGLLVWTIRFGARPAREYWIQQRLRQYRPRQQNQHPRSYNDNIDRDNNIAFAQPSSPTTPTTSTMEMSTVRHHSSPPSGNQGPLSSAKKEHLNRTEPTIVII